MTYLIDTHIFIWSIVDTKKLSAAVKKILEDENNSILVSAVSLWEITIKNSIGKLTLKNFEISKIPEYCDALGFELIHLTPKEAIDSNILPLKENHKDPFDRMLVFQAITNDYNFISSDEKIKQYQADGLKLVY